MSRCGQRPWSSNLVGVGLEVITLTKETEYKTGGIWASVRDNKIRFITSKSNTESVWGYNFFTMLNRTDPHYTGIYHLGG